MKQTTGNSEQQFVSFRINETWYCFNIRYIREINQNNDVMDIPLSDEHVRGLVNIRGQVVLVLDTDVLMAETPRPITTDSQIIILKTLSELTQTAHQEDLTTEFIDDKPICFLTDQIGDILVTETDEIEPVPPHLPEVKSRFYLGVVQKESVLYSILDIPALLEFSSSFVADRQS